MRIYLKPQFSNFGVAIFKSPQVTLEIMNKINLGFGGFIVYNIKNEESTFNKIPVFLMAA